MEKKVDTVNIVTPTAETTVFDANLLQPRQTLLLTFCLSHHGARRELIKVVDGWKALDGHPLCKSDVKKLLPLRSYSASWVSRVMLKRQILVMFKGISRLRAAALFSPKNLQILVSYFCKATVYTCFSVLNIFEWK